MISSEIIKRNNQKKFTAASELKKLKIIINIQKKSNN